MVQEGPKLRAPCLPPHVQLDLYLEQPCLDDGWVRDAILSVSLWEGFGYFWRQLGSFSPGAEPVKLPPGALW